MTTPPHTLTIPESGWPTLTCPHDPPTLDMDCASLVPCIDCDEYGDTSLCRESPTAAHDWVDDQLCHPAAECWAVHYGDLDYALDGRDIAPGTYEVWLTQGAEEMGHYPLAFLFSAPKVGAR